MSQMQLLKFKLQLLLCLIFALFCNKLVKIALLGFELSFTVSLVS